MLDGYVRAASAVLLTAVGLVLLIACANVANMLLARSTARGRELAIRAAIGAGRGRIVRQLLAEGLVLAVAGGSAGALIALWASRAVSGFGTSVFPIPVDFQVSLDATVLLFAVALSLLTAAIFRPRAGRVGVEDRPRDGAQGERRRHRRPSPARDPAAGARRGTARAVARPARRGCTADPGLLAARGADIGYDPAPIASLSFNLQMNGYDLDRATSLRRRAIETLGALPGVLAVSHASRLPLAPDINMQGVKVLGHHAPDADESVIDTVRVGDGYFRAVGVPIVAGRAFSPDDVDGNRLVAIVNETMARRYWPRGSAVGSRIHLNGFDHPAHEIVGVSRDHKVRSVGEDPRAYLHLPAEASQTIGLIVRTSLPAASALPMLRDALWRLEPDIVFTEDESAAAIAAATMAPTRIGAGLMGSFGMLALLLAAIGLYGVIAYAVSLRTREVGIRLALGASRGQVLRQVLSEGGRLAAAGLALGTIASIGVGQILSSLLYGVSRFDPVAYGAATALLLGVAIVANLAPAFAAARIDPLRALRRE